MGIFDYDENGKKLTKKEKDRAKSWAGGISLFILFNLYGALWKEGNTFQKVRMALSWVLFFIMFKLEQQQRPTLDPSLKNWEIVGTIWFFFVIGSWYWRYKESELSE